MVDRVVVRVMTVSSRLDRSVTVGHDGKVMTRTPPRVKVQDMSTDNPIRVLVLEEFRLHAADLDGAAAAASAMTTC